MIRKSSFFIVMAAALAACSSKPEKPDTSMIPADSLRQYVIMNKNGMKAVVSNYGAKVVSLYAPDRKGEFQDVVLGFDSLPDYLVGEKYFGAIVGRYGNRIANGRFSLDGIEYQLPLNDGKNHLHGGATGFHSRLWKVLEADSTGIALEYVSRDGENGYPGTLTAEVSYNLTDDNILYIHYRAVTDKPTIINLTHHSFFNLRDGGKSTINGHELTINASRYTPVDEGLIPDGELAPVTGTPFDFTTPHRIGERIDDENIQLTRGHGYDHNFVLDRPEKSDSLWLAASVYEPESGRVMDVLTTEPGLQFYSGNFLDGSQIGKEGTAYQYRTAFCLETQHFPDSPNHPDFPSIVLKPGEVFSQVTAYSFSVR